MTNFYIAILLTVVIAIVSMGSIIFLIASGHGDNEVSKDWKKKF